MKKTISLNNNKLNVTVETNVPRYITRYQRKKLFGEDYKNDNLYNGINTDTQKQNFSGVCLLYIPCRVKLLSYSPYKQTSVQ